MLGQRGCRVRAECEPLREREGNGCRGEGRVSCVPRPRSKDGLLASYALDHAVHKITFDVHARQQTN